MSKNATRLFPASIAAALVVLATTGTCFAASTSSMQHDSTSVELACADASQSPPCREYSSAGPDSSYSDEYVFGLTRGIADSGMHPAAKILVFPMTVPLDLALLPFEVIGGLF